MLQILKDLFNTFTAPASSQSLVEREHALQLATAVLLVEVMQADTEMVRGHVAFSNNVKMA